MTDRQEYLAGTIPKDANDRPVIVSLTHSASPPNPHTVLTWMGHNTRCYQIERRSALDPASLWEPISTGNENVPGWNNASFNDSNPQRLYRVRVIWPLRP